jgi:osmotically-inducible protein OsmY
MREFIMNSELINENFKRTITELLENSTQVDASDIVVTVNDGDVTLSGTVKDQKEKERAESVIELIQDIKAIHNDLIVKTNPGILPTDIGRQH